MHYVVISLIALGLFVCYVAPIRGGLCIVCLPWLAAIWTHDRGVIEVCKSP